MSIRRRLLVVAVAWALPIAWFVAAYLVTPSDGTTVTTTAGVLSYPAPGDGLTVLREPRDGSLEVGDVVLGIDGTPVREWARADSRPVRRVGETVEYDVLRAAGGLTLEQTVEVTLVRTSVLAALWAQPSAVLLWLLVWTVGAVVFWRHPDSRPTRLFLLATALVPAFLTSAPVGIGAIAIAGARGSVPQLGGEVLAAAGLGALLVAVLAGEGSPRRWWIATAGVPLLAGIAWRAVQVPMVDDPVARWQTATTVLGPAAVVGVAATLVASLVRYRAAADREDRLAARLVLLMLGGGAALWTLAEGLPRVIGVAPVVPQGLLALLVIPALLAGVGVAVARDRLEVVEPTVRRALAQGAVVAVVGAAFVAVVRAVDVSADISTRSMLLGGLAAAVLLPVGLALQRTVRRLVYGDRDLPRRVVSDLRAIDPLAAPEETLQQMLRLLARRLQLSHAAVDVFATATSEPMTAAIGAQRGRPVTVDLAVGGATVGALHLEVDPRRDPFGPADRRLLEDVGSQVSTLVQAVAIGRDLDRSRQRLVATREEERRRLRRDLHDGLGPSLAALALRLDAAEELVRDEPARAAELVGSLGDQVREQIAEVRRLVQALRPPTLDQLGLVSALRQQAADHNADVPADGGRHLSWTVTAADDVEPLPAAVEVAAYRIVMEAVTNAIRHSGGRSCSVDLSRGDGALHLVVRDDGRGLAEDRVPGVGLFSMRERAAELGGSLTLESDASGTTVRAELPLLERGD